MRGAETERRIPHAPDNSLPVSPCARGLPRSCCERLRHHGRPEHRLLPERNVQAVRRRRDHAVLLGVDPKRCLGSARAAGAAGGPSQGRGSRPARATNDDGGGACPACGADAYDRSGVERPVSALRRWRDYTVLLGVDTLGGSVTTTATAADTATLDRGRSRQVARARRRTQPPLSPRALELRSALALRRRERSRRADRNPRLGCRPRLRHRGPPRRR